MTPDQRGLLQRIALFVLFLVALIGVLMFRFVQGTAAARLKNEPKLSTRP